MSSYLPKSISYRLENNKVFYVLQNKDGAIEMTEAHILW